MYRYYMRKSDPEEPPKLEEPIEEREYRRQRSKNKGRDQDSDEKILEEKYYRFVWKLNLVIK